MCPLAMGGVITLYQGGLGTTTNVIVYYELHLVSYLTTLSDKRYINEDTNILLQGLLNNFLIGIIFLHLQHFWNLIWYWCVEVPNVC